MGSSAPSIIGILPARWGSTRFPGKPLHLIAGKPLIQLVWEQCSKCSRLDELIIATDDERILAAAESFGAKAVMTSPEHPTGTDRLAEAVRSLPGAEIIVNIQGDEPLIDPDLIDELAAAMAADPSLDMATAANPLDPADPAVQDPNVVKVALLPQRRGRSARPAPQRHLRLPSYFPRTLRHLAALAAGESRIARTTPRP